MEAKLTPFLIKNSEEKISINPVVIEMVKAVPNPHFVVCYGKTRVGKSTTLSNLIKGCEDGMYYIQDDPIFDAAYSTESQTKGCYVYGPIKLNDWRNRNSLASIDPLPSVSN